jgi:hypothetical protein
MSRSSAPLFSAAKSSGHWLSAAQAKVSGLFVSILAAAPLCTGAIFAGCTNASMANARHQMAAGNYASAHQYFAAEAAKSAQLSPRQRRMVMDGLCLTEYQIGAPSYPLMRQLRSCAAALNQPDSESGPTFAGVARMERNALTKKINTALSQGDIAAADDAILRYRSTPGSDPQSAAVWTRQLWTIVNRDATPGQTGLSPTIAQLSRQFRHEHNMSDPQFRRWIEKNMTVAGNLMVSDVEIGKHSVALWLGDDQLTNAALNLDRFARINDGLVARCHCNARTKVALKDSGLPAYLVRLDAASHQSEVLILDQH